MRVAVLGAGGTIAPAIVRDLAESDEVGDLLLLDLDEAKARQVAEAHGGPRAQAQAVDARENLAEALDGVDVLVNSASYRINLDAMRACLRSGTHYIDLGGLYWMTGRQLELHAEFREAGLLALLGMGSSPGKTNVMAAHLLRQLSTKPTSIEVVAAGRDLDPPDGFSIPYALRTLIDELTLPPVVVRDGQAKEVEPLTPGGEMELPEPIGRADTIYTLHSEVRTFPENFGCRDCSFRLSLAPALLDRLRELVDAPDEEVERAAREAKPPSPHTVSVHVVEGGSNANGAQPAEPAACPTARVVAVTQPMESWGLGGGIVSTAAPAAAAVRLLARGKVEARGALPPECAVHPDDLFPELARRNCSFSTEVNVAA